MTDQNNAPEMPDRIWAWSEDDDFLRAKPHGVMHGTEYIRADRAAPTDNTALVERHANKQRNVIINRCSTDLETIINGHDPEIGNLNNDVWDRLDKMAVEIEAALASREAPPAAQEPVAWLIEENGEGVSIFTRDSSLAGARRSSPDFTVTPLYAAPPPACQQEAVTEVGTLGLALIEQDELGGEAGWDAFAAALRALAADLAAARAEIERLKRELEITHNSRNELADTWKDRAIKAEAERDEARAMLVDAERDMRQRAADVCDRNDQVSGWVSRDEILALPLKHADWEGGV